MGVLSDDFASVDLREELCYHSRPKEAKFKRNTVREKSKEESHARRKKREPVRSGSAGTAPRRRAFGLIFRAVPYEGRVLVSAPARGSARVMGRRQPPRQRSRRLVQDKHTPQSHSPNFSPNLPKHDM